MGLWSGSLEDYAAPPLRERYDGPIGAHGIALLRRVKHSAPDGYRVFRRSDRMAFGRVLLAGFVAPVPRHYDTVKLTPAGAEFLDRLMRVE